MVFATFNLVERKLVGSVFSRNVSIMLFGTILGQATSVLLSPFLTRIYSPEQFGALSVYTSALTILVVAASLRYEIPIATAQSGEEAANLMALSVVALVCTTAAVTLIAALIPQHILFATGLGNLDSYRVLFPVGFAVLGIYFILLYAATWAQDFDGIARTRISQGISGPVSQIVMGLLGLGATGLALGFVIGQSAGSTLLFRNMVMRRIEMLKQITWLGIRKAAWDNRNLPLVSAWSGMIDAAGTGYMAYILVAALYPGPLAGYLFLAERVVARPLQMISTSMLTVFMGEIGRTMVADPAKLRRRFLQVTSRQLLIGAAWVAAIDLTAALFFAAIFGGEWRGAVPYLLVMSIAYLANSVTSSVTHTLQALKRQFLAAAWQIGRMAAVFAVFGLSHWERIDPVWAIVMYAVVQVVANGILFMIMKTSIERLNKGQTYEPSGQF